LVSDGDLAHFSELAYRDADINEGGNQAAYYIKGRSLILAVRGTELDYKDILRDLRAIPWRDDELGWCHSGFLKGARAIWEEAYKVRTTTRPVILTGHSLGGAIATIIAGSMVVAGQPPAALVTFGSPRAGFSGLGKILKDVMVRRYVYGRDVVTTVPHWWVLPYRHVSDEIEIGEKGNPFTDHKISNYVKELEG
jgi:predicted lipase